MEALILVGLLLVAVAVLRIFVVVVENALEEARDEDDRPAQLEGRGL